MNAIAESPRYRSWMAVLIIAIFPLSLGVWTSIGCFVCRALVMRTSRPWRPHAYTPSPQCAVAPPRRIHLDAETYTRSLEVSSQLATMARVVPAWRDGHPLGVKLYAIHPGSLPASLQLRDGDVVMTIAGYQMTSPEAGLAAYREVRHRRDGLFAIEIERNGERFTEQVQIDPPASGAARAL